MPRQHGKPKPIEAQMESPKREEREQTDSPPVPQENEREPEVVGDEGRFQSDDWWNPSPSAPDWSEPVTEAPAEEVSPVEEPGMSDVYFCGNTSLFPLNRALQAIAKEKLTGLLRSSWGEEPIDLFAREGQIVLVTTRDPDLYCSETPPILADVNSDAVNRARDQQKENGTPFLLTLARTESIERQPALDLMRHYGQMLFSQLWSASNVWIVFEKNAELLSGFGDLTGDPDVDDWSLETLRLVQNQDLPGGFNPASIPAFSREGFDRVQKLKLTSDEAQFASQFNGARSVQQIAKNLRLDLKSARQLLLRFVVLQIVECWPSGPTAKPEPKAGFGRLFGRGR